MPGQDVCSATRPWDGEVVGTTSGTARTVYHRCRRPVGPDGTHPGDHLCFCHGKGQSHRSEVGKWSQD